VPYEKIHDLLYFSHLLISESGTMASEAALLGTPVIYINSLPLMGYLREEQDAGLLFHLGREDDLLQHIKPILDDPESKKVFSRKARELKESKIDPTAFLTWFVAHYPQSRDVLQADPAYQDRFVPGEAVN
jgi:predicted glycosyltransferase